MFKTPKARQEDSSARHVAAPQTVDCQWTATAYRTVRTADEDAKQVAPVVQLPVGRVTLHPVWPSFAGCWQQESEGDTQGEGEGLLTRVCSVRTVAAVAWDAEVAQAVARRETQ